MPGESYMGGAPDAGSIQPQPLADIAATFSTAGFTVPMTVQATILLLLAGIVAWAAISDLLYTIIPNAANTALFVLWVAWVVSGAPVSVLYALLIGVGVFLIGAVLFHYGVMGGGDVKLLAVLALWAGPQEITMFMIHVALAGGLLSLLWMTRLRVIAPAFGKFAETDGRRVVPYGVAIAAGAFLLIARLWTG